MTSMKVYELAEKLNKLYKPQPSTYKYWQKSIKPIADLSLEQVSDEVVLNYRVDGLCSLSEGTLKTRIGYLKGMWNKARKWKLVKGENPWCDADDGLSTRRRDPDLHPWEFYQYYHDDPYFVCLWYSGMRISELAGIYPENIHTEVQIPYFDIKHQENRRLKNDESVRKVPIHPACKPYVSRLYLSKAKEPGRSWSENFRENLGLPKGDGAHSIRHSFTSRMRLVGCDPTVLDKLLGHSLPTRTGRYGKFPLEILDRELQKLR
jgi:integrase